MNRHSLTLLAAAALAVATAHADEGMWMPKQLPQIAKPLKAGGLALDPNKLNDLTAFPMGAVVSLGGCTASFVSPQGLVVTNHHCAYGQIQLNSTPENNLIEKGINAATLAQEITGGPNAKVWVTEQITDVTQRMNAALPVDQPDYVLLTLLQAQKAQSCKTIAQPPGGSYVATSGQQPNQNLLPGRMSAGASMVGQDLPAAPQTQDGVASITDARPHAERRQPPRSRSSASAPKGSTRQVFNKMMLNAP